MELKSKYENIKSTMETETNTEIDTRVKHTAKSNIEEDRKSTARHV